ncbi:4-hydroxythreonine-4-phosphate dehydrogenase [Achromobacter ruhlandii]|uniref:4-hydroxythreonine-4-phosphate dehydrogenase n=1 Tax=Achromobacter ruhlandii TaxID=72557 RepID=UPI000AF9C66E|nr:4-hydroxythreonine-4-phosphate dehydrogenase [Achromobacter ruhlandii]
MRHPFEPPIILDIMPADFIFMLTRNDRTVADADAHLDTALACGVRHIGFKDIGQPPAVLRRLNATIRAAGARSYLEVVSQDRDSELASVRAARELEVDCLLGGTHAADALPLLAGSPIRYYPFPGRVHGHPSILGGTREEIARSAAQLAGLPGVHGLDLLAYRADVDVPALMAQVCAAGAPVIVAGSLDTPERIRAACRARLAGFTVGTAALDGRFSAARAGLAGQLAAIQAAAAGA